MLKGVSKLFSRKVKVGILIFIGSLSWSLTMIKSGWIYPYGMGFWGANGHDGVWHIALAESLARGSFQMPVFSGQMLKNYHIGFDLLLAFLHRLTFIPVSNLYFQITPPILAFLVGALTYNFVFNWTKSEKSSLLSVFFVYFGGSFSWLLGRGESAFWSQQAISSLINPPFATSLVFILFGMIFLQKSIEIKNTKYLILSVLCLGLLIEIKVYAGILVIGGLLSASIFEWFMGRKSHVFKTFLVSLTITLILFLLFEKSSAALLVWQPFWFLETMMGLSDRLGWDKFYSAMMAYKSGHNLLKGIPAYLIAFGVFWVGNMGSRLTKELLIWKWVKNLKGITWVEVFISSIVIAGGIIPMFFLQKGTPWNTIQFFYYSLFFSSILGGVALAKANRYLLIAIILLTIPTTIITLKDVYIPSRPPAMLTASEISALKFLSKEPDGVVLTFLFNAVKAKEAVANPPRPLYLYDSTAYVSAFSKHQTFFEDEVNLDITGYDWKARRLEVESWYKEKNQQNAREFLKTNNIKYVYWTRGQRAFLGEAQLGIVSIFENDKVQIFKVN